MNRYIITLVIILAGVSSSGQTFDSFMENVSSFHPDIIAARNLLSADEAGSRTDLTPSDPRLSVGYFPGNEPAPGDKITWGISQSFDFPSRYARLKDLKNSNLELARMEYSFTYIQIMSEARSAAIELISQYENLNVLEQRYKTMNELEELYSTLLENGETTIIEYNKIIIKKVELSSAISSLKNELGLLESRLDFMSGNNCIILKQSGFPEMKDSDIESVMNELKTQHPGFIIPALRTNAAENAVKVSRTGNLPAFEIGFSSEIVADERFTGPSLGISLPVWKNKGKVKKSLADSDYQLKRAERDMLYLESTYRGYYSSYNSTLDNLNLITEAIKRSNNKDLLTTALESGELALTEYLIELGAIYELEDLYLLLNRDKHILLSRLNELDFK